MPNPRRKTETLNPLEGFNELFEQTLEQEVKNRLAQRLPQLEAQVRAEALADIRARITGEPVRRTRRRSLILAPTPTADEEPPAVLARGTKTLPATQPLPPQPMPVKRAKPQKPSNVDDATAAAIRNVLLQRSRTVDKLSKAVGLSIDQLTGALQALGLAGFVWQRGDEWVWSGDVGQPDGEPAKGGPLVERVRHLITEAPMKRADLAKATGLAGDPAGLRELDNAIVTVRTLYPVWFAYPPKGHRDFTFWLPPHEHGRVAPIDQDGRLLRKGCLLIDGKWIEAPNQWRGKTQVNGRWVEQPHQEVPKGKKS